MSRATKKGGVTRMTKVPQGATKPVKAPQMKPYNALPSKGKVARMYDASGNGGSGQ